MRRPLSLHVAREMTLLSPPPDEALVLDREALVRAWREAEETKVLDAETDEGAS